MSKRKDSKTRKAEMISAALLEAEENGFTNLTRRSIASRCDVAEPLINHDLGTLPQLKRTIMRAAVRQRVLKIIAEGLAIRDPHALNADPELKQKAIASI